MDEDMKWSLLVARDTAADGKFFYAVKTTKIFCRPTCKARLARRANVEFFDTAWEAQEAGYRSCKRCQPLLTSHTPEADKIRKAIAFINSIPENAPLPGLERLAKEAGLTKHHFHRLFKRETGLTPRDYALSRRQAGRSETMSSSTVTPLTPFSIEPDPYVSIEDGESQMTSYHQDFFDELKLPSSQEVREVTIYHDFVYTPHGILLVAFRDRRICKIEMGTSEQQLMDRLQAEYSQMYYLHCSVSVALKEDAAIFQRQKDDIAVGLNTAPAMDFDVSAFLQLDDIDGTT